MDCGVQVISNDIIKPSSQTPLHSIKLKLSYIDKFLTHISLYMDCSVEVISNDIIKPLSQIPLHPIKLKLSYIDKFLTQTYIPLLFFYQADESNGFTTSNHLQISQRLKHSLLHILPSFYPLAGRIKNKRFVDCNDAGVEFVEARVRAHLKDVKCTNDQLKQYLPSYCTGSDTGKLHRPLLVVQITFFDCGGLVIAACISHAVGDLASAVAFLNAWAAACRGDKDQISERSFGAASYYPSLSFLPLNRFNRVIISNENYMTERFVFEKKKIDILRRTVTSPSESAVEDPTRVELVSAFIWKHFVAARLKRGETKKVYAASHAVNVRPRTTPPGILENVFGNCVIHATTFLAGCSVSAEDDLHLHQLVCRIRRSIRRVRGGYITKVMGKESFLKDMCKLGVLIVVGKVEWCCFSSWCGFPMYEVDYGWGKPAWFTTPSIGLGAKNVVVLVSSKSGDDVEALVTMLPDDLRILQAQIQLITPIN